MVVTEAMAARFGLVIARQLGYDCLDLVSDSFLELGGVM